MHSLFLALETAMICGPHAVSNYEWAMNAIGNMLWDLSNSLKELEKEEFNKAKEKEG